MIHNTHNTRTEEYRNQWLSLRRKMGLTRCRLTKLRNIDDCMNIPLYNRYSDISFIRGASNVRINKAIMCHAIGCHRFALQSLSKYVGCGDNRYICCIMVYEHDYIESGIVYPYIYIHIIGPIYKLPAHTYRSQSVFAKEITHYMKASHCADQYEVHGSLSSDIATRITERTLFVDRKILIDAGHSPIGTLLRSSSTPAR